MQETFEDFIGKFENSLSNETCNNIVKWFDSCSDKNLTQENSGIVKERKMGRKELADETFIIPSSVEKRKMGIIPSSASVEELDEELDSCGKCLDECFNTYSDKYSLENMNLVNHIFKLHKVKKGGGYHLWHHEVENYEYNNRVLAWMTYLKVPEEGGETEFLYQSKRIKPVVGTTLIWPAHFTHLHRGNPPLKGEKYYLTGWFER
jgi:hypothetical protein